MRVLRVLRGTQATRGIQLLRVLARTNQSMGTFADSFSRRGFGYVVSLTILVALAGAAGMFAFEHDGPESTAFGTYTAALWWTAMLLTTMGSDAFPRSPEGKILCFLLVRLSVLVLVKVHIALLVRQVLSSGADTAQPTFHNNS